MTDPGKTQTIRIETAIPLDAAATGPSSSAAATSGEHPPARRPWVTPTVEDAGVWSATADKHSVPQEGAGAESAKDGS